MQILFNYLDKRVLNEIKTTQDLESNAVLKKCVAYAEDLQAAQEINSKQNTRPEEQTAPDSEQGQESTQTYAATVSNIGAAAIQEGDTRQNGSQENSQQGNRGHGTTQATSHGGGNIHQGNGGHGSFHEHVEDVYAERRRKNIILRGIPEGRCRFTNHQNDENIIYEVLEAIRCEKAYDEIVTFNRLGKRLGKRLLMVTFNNETAVEFILNRTALLNRVRNLKHIYIMKDRPKSERPEGQARSESNRLVEAAAGAVNANRETTTPASRIPIVNPGPTNGDPQNRRPETPNSRLETQNNSITNTGDAQQSNSARRVGTKILEGINRIAGRNLFGESPNRTVREETLASASAEQENAQSGNGGEETQDPMG